MADLRQAAQQALEHVQEFKRRWWQVPAFGNKVNKATREAITNAHSKIFELEHALRAALAEQPAEQEPYCYVYTENGEEYFAPPTAYVPDNAKPLYTAPQPRLIAAAPDLLAALESIASMYDYEAACGDLASRLYEATCLARTAIAKATGE